MIWEIRAISEGTEGENQLELAAIVGFLLLSWNPESWVVNNVKKKKSFLTDLEAEQSGVEEPDPAEGLLLDQIMGDSMAPAEGLFLHQNMEDIIAPAQGLLTTSEHGGQHRS